MDNPKKEQDILLSSKDHTPATKTSKPTNIKYIESALSDEWLICVLWYTIWHQQLLCVGDCVWFCGIDHTILVYFGACTVIFVLNNMTMN